MLFMQPLALQEQLNAIELGEGDAAEKRKLLGAYSRGIWTVLLVWTPIGALAIVCILRAFSHRVDLLGVGVGLLVSVAVGGIVATFVDPFAGTVLGATAGVLCGVIGAVHLSLAVGIISGAAIAAGANTWINGISGELHSFPGVFLAGGGIILALLARATVTNTVFQDFGLSFAFAAIAATSMVLVYPINACLQVALFLLQRFARLRTLHFVPVLRQEVILFPLPFLGRHILLNAEADPDLVRACLRACAVTHGLRDTGQKVLAQLQARELATLATNFRFAEIVELQGIWLPGVLGAEPVLIAFCEIARYLEAAKATLIPYHGLEHLRRARSRLEALSNQLLSAQFSDRTSDWWLILLQPTKSPRLNEVAALVFLAFGLFVLFSLTSYNSRDPAYTSSFGSLRPTNLTGRIGAYLSRWLLSRFGITSFVVPGALFALGWRWVRSVPLKAPVLTAIGLVLQALGICTLLYLAPQWVFFNNTVPAAGYFGQMIASYLNDAIGVTGMLMVSCSLVGFGTLLAFGLNKEQSTRLKTIFDKLKERWYLRAITSRLSGVEGAEQTLALSRVDDLEWLRASFSTRAIADSVAERGNGSDANLASTEASTLKRPLVGTLRTWWRVQQDLESQAEAAAIAQLPNPFRAGEPLRPDRGRAVFRGREALVHQIDSLLAIPDESCSIALLGPRKCGKTSLLRMLPALLPDATCIFFDLQDNPVDSPTAFVTALCRQTQDQALRDRQVHIPDLPPGPPFVAASEWFRALDSLAGERRIMICIDEFDELEALFPGSERDLLQLMALLRATIQNRRRLRLLVSGAAPFDELGRLWNDHFINVRELRVGHLDRITGVNLLTQPTIEFPSNAIPRAVAEDICDRTGCQPYLLQLFGSLLISRLNDLKRSVACLEDVSAVQAEVLIQASGYFSQLYLEAPPDLKVALESFAGGRLPQLENSTRRWLRRRNLLGEGDHLAVPVLGTYVRSEVGT